MSKKNRPADSGGSWMDTYGDMVTLLLTFFIMLYSMSNLDAQKWTIFVKSIPNIQNQGSENITINSQMSDTPEVDSKGQEIGQEDLQAEDVNKLYLTIAESLNQAGVKEATVIRGDDYTYVSFANNTKRPYPFGDEICRSMYLSSAAECNKAGEAGGYKLW